MIIECKKLSEVEATIQEFILEDSIPMPKGETTMISAKGGVGKTNLSLLIASEFIKNHTGCVGLWLTEDMAGNIKYRIDKMIESGIIEPFNEHRAKVITTNPIHFAKTHNKEFVADTEILNSVKMFCIEQDVKMLIFDPLLAFYGGNENDNGQARAFMQPFINWCKEIDINIILIHHSAKGDISNTRGAGAFSDACRCAYVISVPMIEIDKKIVEDKKKMAMGIRTITCTKDNRGVLVPILKKYGEHPFEKKIVPELSEEMINKLICIGEQSAKNILENSNKIKRNISIVVSEFSNDTVEMPEVV